MTDWFPCLAVQGQTMKHGTSDKAHRQVTVERLRFCLPVFSLLLSRILVLVTIMLSWVVHFFVAAAVVVVGHTNILTQHRKADTHTHTYIYTHTKSPILLFPKAKHLASIHIDNDDDNDDDDSTCWCILPIHAIPAIPILLHGDQCCTTSVSKIRLHFAGRAFPELARHGEAHTIVRVSEHLRIICPMRILTELNSEIHIFLRKISLVIFSMIFHFSFFISHFDPYNANEVNTMPI